MNTRVRESGNEWWTRVGKRMEASDEAVEKSPGA
jgi:hypothetical protein